LRWSNSEQVVSAGGKVLDALWQKRRRPHPQTVLGRGKVMELAIAFLKLKVQI
jgi:GTP-binding protein HflX